MPETTHNGNTIYATPSKAFFIEMLTRDISLEECILVTCPPKTSPSIS
jgi:hypothetical protein